MCGLSQYIWGLSLRAQLLNSKYLVSTWFPSHLLKSFSERLVCICTWKKWHDWPASFLQEWRVIWNSVLGIDQNDSPNEKDSPSDQTCRLEPKILQFRILGRQDMVIKRNRQHLTAIFLLPTILLCPPGDQTVLCASVCAQCTGTVYSCTFCWEHIKGSCWCLSEATLLRGTEREENQCELTFLFPHLCYFDEVKFD